MTKNIFSMIYFNDLWVKVGDRPYCRHRRSQEELLQTGINPLAGTSRVALCSTLQVHTVLYLFPLLFGSR